MLVGVLIVGAGGYMSGNILPAIYQFKNKLPKEQRNDLHIIALVEPDFSKYDNIRSITKQVSSKDERAPALLEYLLDSLDIVAGYYYKTGYEYPIIIYDASPNRYHFSNYELIYNYSKDSLVKKMLIYFGEKPFLLDPMELRAFSRSSINNVFCDFIETKNPVFLRTKEYLIANSLKIKKLILWRAGSSGIKKFVKTDREGVEGGALEDKSLHDFSITIGLIGPENIKGSEIISLETTHFLLPRADDPAKILSKAKDKSEEKKFLSTTNKNVKFNIDIHRRHSLPADGFTHMEVLWELIDGQKIDAEYLFSWIGLTGNYYEEKIRQRIRECGLDKDDFAELFIGRNTTPIKELNVSYNVEEVRIGIIECIDSEGHDVVLICNFLPKYGLRRVIYSYNDKKGLTTVFNEGDPKYYDLVKQNNLEEIFGEIYQWCQKEDAGRYINKKVIILTHDLLIKARNRVFKANYNEDEEYKKLIEHYRKMVQITGNNDHAI